MAPTYFIDAYTFAMGYTIYFHAASSFHGRSTSIRSFLPLSFRTFLDNKCFSTHQSPSCQRARLSIVIVKYVSDSLYLLALYGSQLVESSVPRRSVPPFCPGTKRLGLGQKGITVPGVLSHLSVPGQKGIHLFSYPLSNGHRLRNTD